VEVKQEMLDDALANQQEDGDDDVEPRAWEEDVAHRRPLQVQRNVFDRAFADIREHLVQCAYKANIFYVAALKAFYQEEHAGVCPGKNTWNLYQRFANYDDDNRLRERWHLNPSYPLTTPVPALKADKLSVAYKAFLVFTGGEEQADKVLEVFFQMGSTTDDTI
jgi:hypothetical protein